MLPRSARLPGPAPRSPSLSKKRSSEDDLRLRNMPGVAQLSPAQAAEKIKASNPEVIRRINEFSLETFRTRGGRLGSGMGLLLEGLWGYHTSAVLEPDGIEIAWIADNMYNDYACVDMDLDWDPETKQGELLRIEAKSMNLGADESKAHFAEIIQNIGPNDLLLVLVWRWTPDSTGRVWPEVKDAFIDLAYPVAQLRDHMHLARGGTFVDRSACPDGCLSTDCSHHGEPLNAAGKRERLSGPVTRKPNGVQFAANFGGLVRMIGTRGLDATFARAVWCKANPIAEEYVEFILRNRGRL